MGPPIKTISYYIWFDDQQLDPLEAVSMEMGWNLTLAADEKTSIKMLLETVQLTNRFSVAEWAGDTVTQRYPTGSLPVVPLIHASWSFSAACCLVPLLSDWTAFFGAGGVLPENAFQPPFVRSGERRRAAAALFLYTATL
ncbi:MAG: hypothetical protein KDI83_15415 [Gammaproteobacteria bacterium]|nr:hypothetical protein [Gammaproteobacteria bacterium]